LFWVRSNANWASFNPARTRLSLGHHCPVESLIEIRRRRVAEIHRGIGADVARNVTLNKGVNVVVFKIFNAGENDWQGY
jgi:hypothetical protein